MTTKDHQVQTTKSSFPIILPAGIPNSPIDNIGCIPKSPAAEMATKWVNLRTQPHIMTAAPSFFRTVSNKWRKMTMENWWTMWNSLLRALCIHLYTRMMHNITHFWTKPTPTNSNTLIWQDATKACTHPFGCSEQVTWWLTYMLLQRRFQDAN